MAVMYTFCKYFSVRLGSILVAIVSMVCCNGCIYFIDYYCISDFDIQSLVLGVFFLLCLNYVDRTKSTLENLVASYKLIYVTELFLSMEQNSKLYLQCAIVFLMLHVYVCVLLIYAAFKCNVPLVWPFLVVEFIRLAVLFFLHFTVMMIIKENFLDLGVLIALSLSGGFTLLGLYYMWFCVLSLCQCIQELKEDPIRRQKQNVNLLESDFKHLTRNLEGRLTVPPISDSPTSGLQPVPGLRHRDQFGNLGWPAY